MKKKQRRYPYPEENSAPIVLLLKKPDVKASLDMLVKAEPMGVFATHASSSANWILLARQIIANASKRQMKFVPFIV